MQIGKTNKSSQAMKASIASLASEHPVGQDLTET